MDEIGRALEHGWTWQVSDADGITRDPICTAIDLVSEDGHRYQKVHCRGVPVAYIKISRDGTQEFLLPPMAELADLTDGEEFPAR